MKILFIKDVWDILKDLFSNNYPVIFLIVVIIASGFFIWWASKIYYKFKHLPCEDHTNKLNEHTQACEKTRSDHLRKIDEVKDRYSNTTSEIVEIKTNIAFILNGINSIVDGLKNEKSLIVNPFTQRNSPISLTELGYSVADRLNINDIINDNWQRINNYVEENVQSMNPYDIQQFCMQHTSVYPEKFISQENINDINLDAYNTGYSLSAYMSVIAVIVRDRYFKEHDIDVSEVDKHDPNIKNEK